MITALSDVFPIMLPVGVVAGFVAGRFVRAMTVHSLTERLADSLNTIASLETRLVGKQLRILNYIAAEDARATSRSASVTKGNITRAAARKVQAAAK